MPVGNRTEMYSLVVGRLQNKRIQSASGPCGWQNSTLILVVALWVAGQIYSVVVGL